MGALTCQSIPKVTQLAGCVTPVLGRLIGGTGHPAALLDEDPAAACSWTELGQGVPVTQQRYWTERRDATRDPSCRTYPAGCPASSSVPYAELQIRLMSGDRPSGRPQPSPRSPRSAILKFFSDHP